MYRRGRPTAHLEPPEYHEATVPIVPEAKRRSPNPTIRLGIQLDSGAGPPKHLFPHLRKSWDTVFDAVHQRWEMQMAVARKVPSPIPGWYFRRCFAFFSGSHPKSKYCVSRDVGEDQAFENFVHRKCNGSLAAHLSSVRYRHCTYSRLAECLTRWS